MRKGSEENDTIRKGTVEDDTIRKGSEENDKKGRDQKKIIQ